MSDHKDIDALEARATMLLGENSAFRRDLADLANELRRRREADRWVPCGERLPETDTPVAVFTIDEFYFLACRIFDRWSIGGRGIISDRRITHWRPLTPPSEERREA